MSLHTTGRVVECRKLAPCTEDYINRRAEIDYATYARFRGKLSQ
jgi:hydroxymethylglutaryl-CoA synthase